jgi:hypothetical protein
MSEDVAPAFLAELEAAVLACDMELVNAIMFALGVADKVEEASSALRRLLADAPHDVQVWWNGGCDCHPDRDIIGYVVSRPGTGRLRLYGERPFRG